MFSTVRPCIRRASLVTVSVLLFVAGAAQAQQWPLRTVRLVVPFPTGGGTDAFARPLAIKLSAQLGQQVIIDNRGGAGGTIGADAVAKAAPDGYTLLLASATHGVNPGLRDKLPYDSIKDFTPVTLVASSPLVFVAHPALGVSNIKELVAAAKAKPGVITYGSSGPGTGGHLAVELLNWLAGIKLVHIPYKASGSAMTALAGGEAQIGCQAAGTYVPLIKAGKMRALAVAAPQRLPTFADLPTSTEAGLPGYEVTGWYGIMAPANTPADIVGRLGTAIAKALQAPEVLRRFAGEGIDPAGSTPEAFGKMIREDLVKWAEVVRISGARVD